MNANVLVTHRIPQPGLDLLERERLLVTLLDAGPVLPPNLLAKHVRGQDALLCLLTDPIRQDILEGAGRLKIVSNCAAGFNNVDVACATRLGIPVFNTPGVLTDATADLTWALILALTRRIVESDAFTRSGLFKGWDPLLLLGSEMAGSTLGIVGAGRIGQAVAARASGFGMNILYCDPQPKPDFESSCKAKHCRFSSLLKNSDIVSLHVPLLPRTFHFIGERELSRMKPTSFLINTCRGPVVDEKALVQALKDGRIAGAGLDVYENEPSIDPELIRLPNTVLLPHIGSATLQARTRMAVMAAENLIMGLRGKQPAHIVNPEVWDRRRR